MRVIQREEDSPCRPRSRCPRMEPPRSPGRQRSVRAAPPRLLGVDRVLLRAFLRAAGTPPAALRPAGRRGARAADGEPSARCAFATAPTLYAFPARPEIGFGEGYTDGRLEVDGDMIELIAAAYRTPPSPLGRPPLLQRPRSRAPTRWAGRATTSTGTTTSATTSTGCGSTSSMLYTCAYYPTPEATLEEAQVAKMHHVCRKVALRPGERVVEAGCGWGSLALHMARHYGVTVRAFNISHEQIAYARERAAREGLADRVEFVEDDYRNVTGTYDCFMSVGMLEHVGVEQLRRARRGHRPLSAGARTRPDPHHRTHPSGASQRVDREAHLPGRSAADAARDDGDLRAVRLLGARRREPAPALRAHRRRRGWQRFERHVDTVQRMFDERFVRAWRLYLAGTIRRVPPRPAAALPGRLRPRPPQRDPVDAGAVRGADAEEVDVV